MRVRGILFDLYGTLAVYGEMEQAWNAWFDVIFQTFQAHGLTLTQSEFRSYCGDFFEQPEPTDRAGDLTVVERRLQRLARTVRISLPRPQALQAIEKSIDVWHDYVRLDPEAHNVLTELGQNRAIALVSNFDYAPYVHRLMTEWELTPLFDTILVSDAVGVKKPQPGIFEQALRKLNLPAAEVIHVGDSREDIEGAAGAGIRPVWIDRQRQGHWRVPPESGVTCIRSLSELMDLLD